MFVNLTDHVVTRFAPSPTGFLHVGGLRTAIWNWMFARKHGGKFILRIEDTDKARNVPGAEKQIYKLFSWLGIDFDEHYRQSQRKARHLAVAQMLLRGGIAYKEGESIKMEANLLKQGFAEPYLVKFNDKVCNHVTINAEQLGTELTLVRSDGNPTYLLASTVDDFDDRVTHVIRGNDHLSTTAKQEIIKTYLVRSEPPYSIEYAHIPLVHDLNGHKLSKRTGAANALTYLHDGVLSSTLLSYLGSLGLKKVDNTLDIHTITSTFDFASIAKHSVCFDEALLLKANKKNLQRLSSEDLLKQAESYLKAYYLPEALNNIAKHTLLAGMSWLKHEVSTLSELAEAARVLILDPIPTGKLPIQVMTLLESTEWEKDNLVLAVHKLSTILECTKKDIYKLLRSVIAGGIDTAPVIELMLALGKERSIARMKHSSLIERSLS